MTTFRSPPNNAVASPASASGSMQPGLLGGVSKKKFVRLLASDIEHLLSAATRMLEAEAPSVDPAVALGHVLAAVDAARDARTGLSFVPVIIRRLSQVMALPVAHDVLLSAARRELIELRPEGGLGRLSEEELSLCPPGPAGTRLSWARRALGARA
jgi:hypothetical protein